MRIAISLAAALVSILPNMQRPAAAADIRIVDRPFPQYYSPYPTATLESFRPFPTKAESDYERVIRLDGPIEPGDADKLDHLTSDLDWSNTAVVVLNSPGGAFGESLKIADVIRRNRLATFIGPGDVCLSGCGLAFLAGSKQELRGLPSTPARTIHVDGRVGLHAPFNSALPANLNTEGLDVAALAEMFFSQSRETIRELQRRILPWQISPNTVFEFLGYGPKEFYELDRFWRLHANWVNTVADKVTFPHEIDFISATSACDFVLTQNLGPAYNYEWNFAYFNNTDIQGVMDGAAYSRVAVDGIDSEFAKGGRGYTRQAVISGRGPFNCHVWKDRDGRWVVKTDGDYPTAYLSRTGYDSRVDKDSPYPVSDFTILGPGVPFEAAKAPDLTIENRDELEKVIPAQDRGVTGPSFDCNGKLDPAATVICRFPTLARLDGVMVRMYVRKLAKDPAEKKRQRDWLALRQAACRTDAADLGDRNSMLMNGYCLLYLTVARMNQMKAE